jgi:hypothetical protein
VVLGARPSTLAVFGTLAAVGSFAPQARAAEDVLLEFHFQPVPHAQIAIWLVDADGAFVQDVMVTQATGTLGIGNRPGRWDFLSSWRFPYGPRPQVLPVWAHARGKSYPGLIFHDDDPSDLDSLGWHENSSSPEPYFCRPLTDAENATISTDTMTCPSPATFQSDKGRFDDGDSPYPPRNDLVTFEDGGDHIDVQMFGVLNDLDAVTSATPAGYEPELYTAVVPKEAAERGPMTAFIEINLEHDENDAWAYDRETDHYVDPRLSGYGVEYLGQPSVVYSVEFDPQDTAFTGTDMFVGYGEWDGSTGALHPPDDSISVNSGSGADRLQLFTKNDETFRFGVYSHGPNSGTDPTGGSGSGSGSDSDSDDGGSDTDPTGGWGCDIHELPAPDFFELEPMEFDTVRVHFSIPADAGPDIRNVRLYYRTGDIELTEETVSSAIQAVPTDAECSDTIEAGETAWCDLHELFGSYHYQVGLRYEDNCSNKSMLVADAVQTPAQKFQTVEGFCFIATAAYGGQWTDRVQALRYFRDLYMRQTGVGYAMIEFYYANSPALAKAIAPRPWARALTRALLGPIADFAQVTTPRVSTTGAKPS